MSSVGKLKPHIYRSAVLPSSWACLNSAFISSCWLWTLECCFLENLRVIQPKQMANAGALFGKSIIYIDNTTLLTWIPLRCMTGKKQEKKKTFYYSKTHSCTKVFGCFSQTKKCQNIIALVKLNQAAFIYYIFFIHNKHTFQAKYFSGSRIRHFINPGWPYGASIHLWLFLQLWALLALWTFRKLKHSFTL